MSIQLNMLDACVCFAYLVLVFGLALKSACGQQDNEDYFVGGRNMNWWVVGISMFATSFSSVSFLGLPQPIMANQGLVPVSDSRLKKAPSPC